MKKIKFVRKKVKDLDSEDYFVCNCCEGYENIEYLHYYLRKKETLLHEHPYWVFRSGRTGRTFILRDGEQTIYTLKQDKNKA